jgi:hypothetical protein
VAMRSFLACSTSRTETTSGGQGTPTGVAICATATATPPVTPPNDKLAPIRLLRRISLTLTGRLPAAKQVEALENAATDDARANVIEDVIEEDLKAKEFYEGLVDFGHSWMRTQAFKEGASGDGYFGGMATHLTVCPPGSKNAGAYVRNYSFYDASGSAAIGNDLRTCDGLHPIIATPNVPFAKKTITDAWWAPGTSVTLLGDAAKDTTEIPGAKTPDCGRIDSGYYDVFNSAGCGCGPNATWCSPSTVLDSNNDKGAGAGSIGQPRDIWDEDARLVAHIGWHDKPLSDIILGDYTVATLAVKHWYVRFAREIGQYAKQQDANTTWWQPDPSAQRDPIHPDAKDPASWQEIVQEAFAPNLLKSRNYRYDPRKDAAAPLGLPSAGVFTTPGYNSSFPRERPKAARALEIFACKVFAPPPPEQHFTDVGTDIAKTGACQHCHGLMDPAAIAFKRWFIFQGSGNQYARYAYLAGTGNALLPSDLYAEPGIAYKYENYQLSGAERWRSNFKANTVMTPVSEEDLKQPRNMFMDTIPMESQLFGLAPDGTMGPLALSKILVESGEFDRCAVQKIYERFVGRKLNASEETRYIRSLSEAFVKGERKLRPFLRELLKSEEFRRGI